MVISNTCASQCPTTPDPPPNPTSPAATAISSLLASLRSQPTPNIGCFVRGPIELPETDGFFSDFDNGQIVWSSSQQMVLAAYWTGSEQYGQITVQWQILAPLQYDLFLVRWNDVALPANEAKQANASSAGGSNINTYVIGTGGTQGTGGTAPEPDSRYSIIVEGCKKGATFKGDVCAQGWSAPAYVDVNPIDVLHDIAGKPLAPAATPTDTSSTFDDRVRIGFARSCSPTLSGPIVEHSAWLALGKLYMAGIENAPSYCDSAILIAETNSWLAAAKVTTLVGTTYGLRHGDYDMALVNLIPLIYNFGNKLTPAVRQKFLHGPSGQTPLLSQSGGVNEVRTKVSIAGYHDFSETENHIMNTESARYLTNQLLLEEAESQNLPPQSPILLAAQETYDNSLNGLQGWMLSHLQRFAMNDFHEYNARPYMNLSIAGIHNLAEYATDVPVKTAATIILNYLAAKLAVSSSGFRRAAPFRRHYEASDFNLLIEEGTDNSNNHDQAIWLEPTIFGTTQLIQALRHGHLEWKAEGDMSRTSFGQYRVPDLILDLVMRDEADLPTPFAPSAGLTYFQVFRHEGVELYARDPNFLISAGGDWEPNTPVDQWNIVFGMESTNGAALPTTLMPAWDGDFIAKMVQIGGNSNEKKRSNTCVAPGFACGLNPIIPIPFMQKVITGPRPCAASVTGVISEKWNQLGGQDGMLGCPLSAQTNLAGGSLLQQFERGQIVFSQPQGMVVAGFYQKGSDFGFGIDWTITSSLKYDFFLVRWNKNGTNVGQHKIAESKAGAWTAPSSGFGSYTMIVEGCHNRTAAPASCGQSWTLPVEVDFPAQNSCFRTDPTQNWVFLDVTNECGAPAGQGFSVAVFRAPCSNSTCSYGFFEAVDESKAAFNNFMARTLANNGQTQFSATGINSYTTFNGNVIDFTPEHSADKWGIVSMTNQSISSDMSQWHLAKGDIIDADGKGCIVIKNPILGQALVMDLRTNANGVINPTIVSASLFPAISCDTTKP